MECIHCKGRRVRGAAPFSKFGTDRKGYHVAWDAVPAWICHQCGGPHFEAREVERIQRALALLDRECAVLTSASEPTAD